MSAFESTPAKHYPAAEEQAESVGQEERLRWESTRAWALTEWRAVSAEAWRAVSAEAARRQVLWEAEKAIEDVEEGKRSAEDACDWTPAEQAEALREAAAVLEAEAAERARWKSFAEGWFADAEAAILRQPLPEF